MTVAPTVVLMVALLVEKMVVLSAALMVGKMADK